MRLAITLLVTLLLVTSCRSVQKMVDRGQYDQAIAFAARKLHGKSEPKTKYVQGLEEAFAKVMDRDLQEIDYLKMRGDAISWERVYDIYRKIEDRQQSIAAFLPLISRDGYVASFRMIDPVTPARAAADSAMVYYYKEAKDLLRIGDKVPARQAMQRLQAIGRFDTNYSDVSALLQQAQYQGTTRVAVSVVNRAPDYLPAQVMGRLQSLDLLSLAQPWVEYYYANSDRADTDIEAVIEIDRVQVSPGIIDRARWTEKNVIEVSRRKKRDQRPKRLDSLSSTEMVVQYDTVFAELRSARFTREADIQARLVYYDYQTGLVLSEVPLRSTAVFDEYGVEYSGDERALANETRRQLRSITGLRLPDANDLLADAGYVLKGEVLNKIDWDIQ